MSEANEINFAFLESKTEIVDEAEKIIFQIENHKKNNLDNFKLNIDSLKVEFNFETFNNIYNTLCKLSYPEDNNQNSSINSKLDKNIENNSLSHSSSYSTLKSIKSSNNHISSIQTEDISFISLSEENLITNSKN